MPDSVKSVASIAIGAVLSSFGYVNAGRFFIALGVNTILSARQASKARQRRRNRTPGGIKANLRGGVNPLQIVYGESRVGGQIYWFGGRGSNNYLLTYGLALSICNTQGVQSITDVWVDDVKVNDSDIDGSNNVTSGVMSGFAYIERHLGTSTQSASSELQNFSEFDSLDTGAKIAHMVCRFKRPSTAADEDAWREAFPYGPPANITALVKGAKVYDPRKDDTAGGTGTHRTNDESTWEYSANPALIWRDYVTRAEIDGGMGKSQSFPDDTLVSAAANVCDETLTVPDGSGGSTTITKYRFDGLLSCGDSHEDNIKKILECMDGTVNMQNGQIWAGAYDTPTHTMDETWLRDRIRLQASLPRKQRYNAVRATFVEPDTDWEQIEAQSFTSSAYETEDGGERLWQDLELEGVTNQYRAQYLSLIEHRRSRHLRTVIMPCNLKGLDVELHETVKLTIDELGWTDKIFRVIDLKINADLTVDLTLQEETSSIYTDALSDFTEVTPEGVPTRQFEQPIQPQNLNVYPIDNAASVVWTRLPEDSFNYVEIWRAPDSGGASGTYAKVASTRDAHGYVDGDVTAGTTYWYKVRTVGAAGQKSLYSNEDSAKPKTVEDGATDGAQLGNNLVDSGSTVISNIDGIPDGSTYGRPVIGALDGSNNVDFGAAGVVNRLIGNVTDASIWAKEGLRGVGENLIKNPGAEDGVMSPHHADGGGGAWFIPSGDASSDNDIYTGQHSFKYDPTGQIGTAQIILNGDEFDREKHVSVEKGQRFILKARYNRRGTGDGNRVQFLIQYRKSDGTFVDNDSINFATSSVSFEEGILLSTARQDAGFVSARVRVLNDGNSNTINFDAIEFRRADVIDAGSGYRVGDQRNIVQIGVGNRQSTQSTQPLTTAWIGDPANFAEIYVASHSLYIGGQTISYSSGTISNLSGGIRYYVYIDDADFSGTGTYQATTNFDDILKSDDRYYVGYITTASSSSSGGSPGAGGGTDEP